MVAIRYLIWGGILACITAGIVAVFRRTGRPAATHPHSAFSRLVASKFAAQAPWYGLIGSPVCMAIFTGLQLQLELIGKGAQPFVCLLLIALVGILFSLLGAGGAIRSVRMGLLIVSILGLLFNGIVGIQLLAVVLLEFSYSGRASTTMNLVRVGQVS